MGLDLEVEAQSLEVRGEAQGGDVAFRHPLQPDRLPDPGGAGVEDAPGLPQGLLAPGGFRVQGVVLGPHQDLHGPFQEGGEVQAEGGVPPSCSRTRTPFTKTSAR